MIIKPGEIRLLDYEVLPLDRMERLDAAMDKAVKRNIAQGRLRSASAANRYYLGAMNFHPSEEAALNGLLDEFDAAIDWPMPLPARTETHLISGLLSNPGWHADRPGDIRALTNLGLPTTISVAAAWDPAGYIPGEVCPEEPEEHYTLSLETGQTCVINNLVTDHSLLRPHETPDHLGRRVLRASYYPEGNWLHLAGDGGVEVNWVAPS